MKGVVSVREFSQDSRDFVSNSTSSTTSPTLLLATPEVCYPSSQQVFFFQYQGKLNWLQMQGGIYSGRPRTSATGMIRTSNSQQQDSGWRQMLPRLVGELFAGGKTRGYWSSQEKFPHINCLEFKAGAFVMKSFMREESNVHVHLNMYNQMVVAYINKIGGTHSQCLMEQICKL